MLQETVWLYDTPIAVIKQNQTYAIHTDHLNTPRLITDSSNQTVWAWPNAEAFGDTPANQNPQGLGIFEYHLRYPGQLYDTETKTHYNYFRDNYAPDSGRYKQSDPIGLAGGINTYLYVGGNPVRYVDEKGRLAHVVAGALAGGLFGALGSGFQSWTQGNGFFNLEALANGFVGGTIGGAFAASGFYFAGGALSSGITDALSI